MLTVVGPYRPADDGAAYNIEYMFQNTTHVSQYNTHMIQHTHDTTHSRLPVDRRLHTTKTVLTKRRGGTLSQRSILKSYSVPPSKYNAVDVAGVSDIRKVKTLPVCGCGCGWMWLWVCISAYVAVCVCVKERECMYVYMYVCIQLYVLLLYMQYMYRIIICIPGTHTTHRYTQ